MTSSSPSSPEIEGPKLKSNSQQTKQPFSNNKYPYEETKQYEKQLRDQIETIQLLQSMLQQSEHSKYSKKSRATKGAQSQNDDKS